MRSGQVSRVSISATEFFSPRFVQFMLEIGIIGLYFMMGLHLELPQKTGPVPPPDLSWLLASLLLVFAAYLVWDLLDILIACMPPDENNNKNWSYSAFAKSATIGAVVTLAVTIATAVCYAIVRSAHPAGQRAVLVWCLALIAVAYGYRVAQEKAKKRWG
jgi:hypothetical protein